MKARNILVVEDEPDIALLLRTRLESSGYAVRVAEDGKTALDQAQRSRPDLVILDLRLPDVDGLVVSEQLRKLYHEWSVPILMLTARDMDSDRLHGFGAGADAYLTKPYDASDLLDTVEHLLRDAEA